VFGFDSATGYNGLLVDKRAVVVYTAAVYHEGAPLNFGADFHRTYFNDWLRWAGIDEVSEVRFQPNLRPGGPCSREGIRASAGKQLRRGGPTRSLMASRFAIRRAPRG
jgi:FMN-dependent NADH-azoreductase